MMQCIVEGIPEIVFSNEKDQSIYHRSFDNTLLKHKMHNIFGGTYSKKRSRILLIVPELTNSFSATSFPVFSNTAMNSTIYNLHNNTNLEWNCKQTT